MTGQLDALQVTRKSGNERLTIGTEQTVFSLLDFWQWSCSDLSNNTFRGRFAEYIVACALGLNSGARIEWDAHDILCIDGLTIQVKSAAYIQSWKQLKHSKINFNISAKKFWDAKTATYSKQPGRPSQLYVFSLLDHKDKHSLNLLDLNQWKFFVLKTSIVNDRMPKQKTLALSVLLTLGPKECTFASLSEGIANVAESLDELDALTG